MERSRRSRPPSKTLDDLRPLLVGPEQDRIRRLEDRLDQHMGELVADALPEAVTQSRKKGEALAWAMEPIVEKGVRDAVHRDPGGFAEAISPAIGPAIRKTVAAAVRVMLQRFNAALERSLSLASIRWRIEARRTGRPFAEVVLLRTLVYRVEQLFLIHRDTGLLLQHLVSPEVAERDPEQIAAMVSAIESFSYEAFREDARLERFRVGELGCWVEHGPSALLVAVVRGTAPEDYETALRQALERTHLELGGELSHFRGDASPFEAARELLVDCLQERSREPRRKWIAPAVLGAAVAAVVGLSTFAGWREHRRFAAYVDALRGQPGLVVTTAEEHGRSYVFAGLRDPLAADPKAALAERGLDPGRVTLRFEPFYSLDPGIVARRCAAILHPPPGVSLSLHEGTLDARGVAPARWIARAETTAAALPGIQTFSDERLFSEETVAHVRDAARALDGAEILFAPGSDRAGPTERARLDAVAGAVAKLVRRAPEAGLRARVEVVGYADPTGSDAFNQAIALARAEHVAAALAARGVAGGALSVRGGGVRAEVLGPGCEGAADRTGCAAGDRRARSAVVHVALQEEGG